MDKIGFFALIHKKVKVINSCQNYIFTFPTMKNSFTQQNLQTTTVMHCS